MTGPLGATLRLRNRDHARPWRRDIALELVVPGHEPVELGLEHLSVYDNDELRVEWDAVREDYPDLWPEDA